MRISKNQKKVNSGYYNAYSCLYILFIYSYVPMNAVQFLRCPSLCSTTSLDHLRLISQEV